MKHCACFLCALLTLGYAANCCAIQNFCAEGACLVVTADGEILFANQYIGKDLWQTGRGQQVLTCQIKGKKMYVTVDEDGKMLYLAEEPEPGSYWEYTPVEGRKGVVTTIRTVESLKGGPFYIAIDTDKPEKRKGRHEDKRKDDTEYTVYPVKITSNSDAKGIKLSSKQIAP